MNYELITRLLLGIPLVYLISGFPLARLFLPQEKTVSLRLLLASFAASLFLTYPAAVLTIMIEGQSAQAIYSVHLPTSLFSLFLISLVTLIILMVKNKNWYRLSLPKITTTHYVLFLIVLVYSFFVFWNLNRADVVGDEYDLGYQAYDLNNGLLASRKAYLISADAYPSLTLTMKHFGMNLFSPYGLGTLQDWMFRGVEGVIGVGIILTSFLLVRDHFSFRVAILVAALLSVNNYLIFLGRYFNREIYLTFFLTLSLYFFLRRNFLFCFFLLGCAFLVKIPAITLFLVFTVFFLIKKQIKNLAVMAIVLLIMYFPVLIFNLGGYLLTGHVDAVFSAVFGIRHPNVTPIPPQSYLVNSVTTFFLLADAYSWLILGFMFSGLVFVFWNQRTYAIKVLLWWLGSMTVFFMFTPMRAYYLLSFTMPLIVFLAILLEYLGRKTFMATILIVTLLIFSARYSFSSNLFSRSMSAEFNDLGAGGDFHLLKKNFWHSEFSFIAAIYSQEAGWKNVTEQLKVSDGESACLIKGFGVSDLPLRRYFGADDLIKKSLLGDQYPRKFFLCDELPLAKNRVMIYYTDQGTVRIKQK